MPDNFYVAPLGGMNLGAAIGEAITGGETRYRQMQIKKKMPEVLKSNDPDKMYEFVSEYPEARQMVQEATGMKDEMAVKQRVVPAIQILEGQDPVAVYEKLAQETGGKEPWVLDRLGEALQNPQASFDRSKRVVALNAPDAWKSYQTMFTETEGQKEGPTTTEDRYAKRKITQWDVENPDAPKAERDSAYAEFMKEYKRAQAPEVTATTTAKEQVETDFAKNKAYQTAVGKAVAEIEYATPITHAKGDLTPQEKKLQAKTSVTNKLATLAGYYAELDDMKSIVNLENTSMENLWASLQASKLGQYVGTRLGAKPQSIRNAIKSMKPQLMNDMRQATEMGARGLDSEKELEFYLQAMTDETKDMQSNIAAMIVLDEAYGDGQIASELKKMNVSPQYIEELKQQGTLIVNGALLTDTERAKRIKAGRKPLPSATQTPPQPSGLPQGVTEEDIQFTMQKHGVSREDVLKRLGGQ